MTRPWSLFGILALMILVGSSSAQAQVQPTEDVQLKQHLIDLLKTFRGDVGIYVRHLTSGREVAIRADELFPTASMIKVPILLALFDKMHRGELDYHEELVYRDSLLYPGEDILGSFRDSATIALSKVVMLMITTSDNTASLWCQSLAGTAEALHGGIDVDGITHVFIKLRNF